MRAFGIFSLIAIFAVAGAACGGKKDEAKTAEQAAQQAASQAGGAPQDLAKSMEQFGNAMQQLQKGPNGENIEPVDFTALQAVLPTFAGWEREEPKGESMTAPFKFSQAETAYTKDESRIEVKIVDTAMSQMLTMPSPRCPDNFLAASRAKSTSAYEASRMYLPSSFRTGDTRMPSTSASKDSIAERAAPL